MSDVFHFVRYQAAGEAKAYSPDFSRVIPTGASIPAGSAAVTYTQTYGGASSGSVPAVVSPTGVIVTYITPALAVGAYRFIVSASLSDGQVRWAVYDIQAVS